LAATFFFGECPLLCRRRAIFWAEFFAKPSAERYSVLSALQELADSDATETRYARQHYVLVPASPPSNVLSRFEALGEQVAAVPGVGEAIIDGEVIVVDETGRPVFIDLLRRKQAPG